MSNPLSGVGAIAVDMPVRLDPNLDRHHHLVCTQCRRVDDFYWPDFDVMKTPGGLNGWGEVLSRQVVIRGLCQDCRKTVSK